MKILHCKRCQKDLALIQIKRKQQYCSRKCKTDAQVRRITLICNGCHKSFSIWPHLKRKTNYCSLKCYHDSTRVKEKRFCKVCKKEFYATGVLIKKGFGIYCGLNCLHSTYPKRIAKKCKQCQKPIFIQPCKINLVKFCSKKCKDDFERDYENKVCTYCHKQFQLPSWETKKGKGLFCSMRCFLLYKGETTIEKRVRYALQRSKIKFSQEVKIGTYRVDFLLPEFNLIVECDGEYWHDRKPGVIKRDQRKTVFLQKQGYEVVRLPEQTIRKTPIIKLQELLRQQILERQTVLQPQMPL